MARSISARAISGFVRAVRYSAGTPARSNRSRLLVQLSGRNSRNASMTGTSPRESVSDTRVWQLAVLPSAEAYCAATPTECVPFLGSGVVDHQHGIAAADQPIRLNKQFRLHRPRIPDPGRNEVVQLIVFAKPKPLRHGLNALTSARTDQPRHVEWTHLSPRLVTQPIQKRLEKASKLFFPIRCPANHGRPLQKPTTHESQKN